MMALCTGTSIQAQATGGSGTSDATANSGDAALDDIVITAQRYAEPLSKTPISVSALSGESIANRHITSIQDFNGAIPGLTMNYYSGRPLANIRGVGQTQVGATSYSQIAFNINGVYVSSAVAQGANFLDLERIEVLRGPQGTLYGRNATGGAINLITAKPTDQFFSSGDVTVGNYGRVSTQAVVSGPLADGVSARLVVASDRNHGYSRNLADGKRYDSEDWQAVRGTFVFGLTDRAKLTVVGDYYHRNDGTNALHFFGFGSPSRVLPGVVAGGTTIPIDANGQAVDPRLLSINSVPDFRIKTGGVTADLEWELSDALTFRSISAYRQLRNSYVQDLDLSTFAAPDFRNRTNVKQTSQEFQLLGDFDGFKWVTGLYYFKRSVDPIVVNVPLNLPPPGLDPLTNPSYRLLIASGTQVSTAYAAFAQGTLELVDRLSLTAGLRYTKERNTGRNEQRLPPFPTGIDLGKKETYSDWSPKVTLSYQASSPLLFYATVSKGFLAGGYNITQRPPLTAYGPETLWSYEGGVKYRQRWLSLDLSAFHYDYKDLQVSRIVNSFTQTVNAGRASVDGFEVETTLRPSRYIDVSGSFSYVDGKYKRYANFSPLTGIEQNLSGNPLAGSAKYQGNIYGAARLPIGERMLRLSAEWNRRSRVFFDEFALRSTSQGAVSTINASLRFGAEDDHWYVEAFGKNLTNRDIAVSKFIDSPANGRVVVGQLAAPRTYGLSLHYDFGK